MAEHPCLAVELSLSNDSADLVRREADFAVRMLRPTQARLVAQRLGPVPLGLFAQRAYLDRAGRPNRPEDLVEHVLIGPDADPTALAGLAAFGGLQDRAALRLRSDSEAAQIASVRAGLGIGVIQAGIAAREQGLEPVLPGIIGWSLEAWLVLHDDLRRLPMVRRVADHLSVVLPALLAEGRLSPQPSVTRRAT
ncbi:LysR substrate-binding domain-containing protein [Roseicyclus persicicus]|uniref:LysR substrate-binding domain-containing protein n=1 Tax=Roseicyclus persicicus TaxID=2650661 RepID=UPI0023B2E3E3|nr:LysR substrate-binding domain-containing protein [Roseibacterium persicicum]